MTGTDIAPRITGTASSNTTYGLYVTSATFSTLTLERGSVALAIGSDESVTVTTINQGYVTNVDSDTRLLIGDGVSSSVTLKKTGGSCTMRSSAGTVQNDAGQLKTEGGGTITTANIVGGTFFPNSSGTITTLSLKGGSTDFTQTLTARTVTTLTLYAGASLAVDKDVVALANDLALGGAIQISSTAA